MAWFLLVCWKDQVKNLGGNYTRLRAGLTSRNFVFIALLTLAGIALTSGAVPLATSTSYAATSYIWGSGVVPLGTTYIDPQSIEVGVKSQSTQAGYITGLRFYKAAGDTGTHVGNLWKIDGTLLRAQRLQVRLLPVGRRWRWEHRSPSWLTPPTWRRIIPHRGTTLRI